jgi:hypothetical protein
MEGRKERLGEGEGKKEKERRKGRKE